jgi:histidinol-phosphate/aromatic aminotransferase/cobyric acid decarboxylase-like protein
MTKDNKTFQPTFNLDLNTIDVRNAYDQKKMYRFLASYYEVQEDELEVFNGHESMVYALFMYVCMIENFQGKCYIFEPCSKVYSHVANIFLQEVQSLNHFEAYSAQKIEQDAMVIMSNPAKFDGKWQDLSQYLQYCMKKNALIIIDESYLDFCTHKSISHLILNYEKLYVLKCIETFYELQGIKIACLISSKNNIAKLKTYEAQHKISTLDMAYMSEMLKDKNHKRIVQGIYTKNSILLKQMLEKSGLFEKIYESNTNVLLTKLKNITAKTFQHQYKEASINMQSFSEQKFLDEYHLQFTLYNEEQIRELETLFQNNKEEK